MKKQDSKIFEAYIGCLNEVTEPPQSQFNSGTIIKDIEKEIENLKKWSAFYKEDKKSKTPSYNNHDEMIEQCENGIEDLQQAKENIEEYESSIGM